MDDFVQEVEKESRKLAIEYGLPHNLVRSIPIRGIGISMDKILESLNKRRMMEGQGVYLPKKCPECGRLWKEDANFCGFCGIRLVEVL